MALRPGRSQDQSAKVGVGPTPGRVWVMSRIRMSVVAVTLLLVAALLGVVPAYAAGPTLTLSPATGAPTSKTTVTGTAFPANILVDVYFDSSQVGFGVTGDTGSLTYSLTVPASAQPGSHMVTVAAHSGGQAAQKAFTVRSNWLSWRGDSAGRGWNRTENVLDSQSVSTLDLDWTPGTPSVHASPVVAGAYVYIVTTDGNLRAYDRNTHALKFNVAAGANYLIAPTVSGSPVYVVATGAIQARSTTTGALVWKATLPSGVGEPVVSAGVVYVVAEGTNSGVYAFSTTCATGGATCTPLWYGPGGLTTGGSYFFPEITLAVAGGRVLARLGNDLVAFGVGCGTGGATCTAQGTVSGGVTGMGPVVSNNYVFIAKGASLVALRPSCLACGAVWTATLPGTGVASVSVANSKVYVVEGATAARLRHLVRQQHLLRAVERQHRDRCGLFADRRQRNRLPAHLP